VAILLFIRRGADALRLAPFDGADFAYRAILFTAFALLFSAAVDTFIFLDLAWANGEYTVTVVTGANLVALGIIAIAVASASRSHAPAELGNARLTSESTNSGIEIENDHSTSDRNEGTDAVRDSTTFLTVQAMMESKHVYRDVDLNLNRLARKLGIPTRQVSTSINRATGKNVSQYVNEFRISEACGLLETTEKPVTEIMFEVGFQTKSNFNREFRRVTEMNPVEWHARRGRTA
jgi:AraC-like DNA-binding protein